MTELVPLNSDIFRIYSAVLIAHTATLPLSKILILVFEELSANNRKTDIFCYPHPAAEDFTGHANHSTDALK